MKIAITLLLTEITCFYSGFKSQRDILPLLLILATRQDGYFSSSRTCEIGMTRATGQVYRSYLHLVERATRP